MDGNNMTIDLDKLPIKRLESIDEAGVERFPPEIGPDENRLDLIRRIDFSAVVERDSKKAKSSKEAVATPAAPWPWQSMLESLQLAHQELSVIIDLINTVEANDAVTVAGMTRPKQLPNELLSDLAVSAATKLQRFRHLGRYFKQSSKALEQQVAREARFYGSLIRLQQNWKVKRQRPSGPCSEGFTIDLLDNSLSDPAIFSRPSSISTVRVDRDFGGMLTVQLPPQSCRSIHFGFLGGHPSCKPRKFSGRNVYSSTKHPSQEARKEPFCNEDVNESVKETHSILRGIHQSIFEEQVFDLVNRETFYSSPGVYVTGMREDYLQLGIGQETSAYLCLESSAEEDANKTIDSNEIQSGEGGVAHFDSLELMIVEEKQDALERNLLGLPNPSCYEIYLQYILHENIFLRAKERQTSSAKPQVSSQFAGDGLGLLGHFCMTIAHRIFSNKVLSEMENLVSGVPYLHLLSHPTWHSRTSSWSLTMKVPQSVLHAGRHAKLSDIHETRSGVRLQFHTKVVVNDEYISISGEGTPTIIGSFDGSSTGTCLLNCYGCDLAGLPTILLQQVASQVIRWLHEEALVVGMKASMEFLCLYFELDQGEKLGLAAHVNPENAHGRITWWLVMDDGSTEEGKLHADSSRSESENRRFLGHLSLEALYSTLMDLVSLCCSGGSC